jgi:hypothetical protein
MATRGYREPRPCPVRGCQRAVPAAGKLTCAPHWHALQRDLQRAVLTTWRAWNTGPTRHSTPAWEAYLDARDAALTALGGERDR